MHVKIQDLMRLERGYKEAIPQKYELLKSNSRVPENIRKHTFHISLTCPGRRLLWNQCYLRWKRKRKRER